MTFAYSRAHPGISYLNALKGIGLGVMASLGAGFALDGLWAIGGPA